jgi:hypothetical protein
VAITTSFGSSNEIEGIGSPLRKCGLDFALEIKDVVEDSLRPRCDRAPAEADRSRCSRRKGRVREKLAVWVLGDDARTGPTRADARLAADPVANGWMFAAPGVVAARSERSVGDLACEAYCRGVTITVCGRITGDLDGAVRTSVEPRAARDLEFANV